jgi:hypothetical protein
VALGGAWRGGGVYCGVPALPVCGGGSADPGVPDVPNCEVLGCAGLSGCADPEAPGLRV